jgi:2,4-dienoyl-CoA reductase-like NADH-dependent reductase (Old Yellow Enzyme family)
VNEEEDQMDYDVLFEPLTVGDVELKNRIAMAPMNMVYSDPEGFNSEQWLAWYAARAKGGFGLIITDCVVVNPHPWRGSDHLNPHLFIDERYGRGLGVMADNIHAFGAKVFIQLSPGFGRQGHASHLAPNEPSAAPSPIPFKVDMRNFNDGWEKTQRKLDPKLNAALEALGGLAAIRKMDEEQYANFEAVISEVMLREDPGIYRAFKGDVPRELRHAEIVEMEDLMAYATREALRYGYDGVEIHSPHGYLIHQFLSKRSNQRVDEYGGPLENRVRFLLNIIRKTRELIGPDRILGARFSGDEIMPNGVTNREMQEIVGRAAAEGLSYISVSQGCYENPGAFTPDGEGDMLKYGPGFKRVSGLPVFVPNMMTPEASAEAISSGQTDMVMLGRQAIADPYWPAKVKAGREKDIVRCARCNTCLVNLFEHKWLRCEVNPTAGFEKYLPELWRLNAPAMQKRVKKYMSRMEGL